MHNCLHWEGSKAWKLKGNGSLCLDFLVSKPVCINSFKFSSHISINRKIISIRYHKNRTHKHHLFRYISLYIIITHLDGITKYNCLNLGISLHLLVFIYRIKIPVYVKRLKKIGDICHFCNPLVACMTSQDRLWAPYHMPSGHHIVVCPSLSWCKTSPTQCYRCFWYWNQWKMKFYIDMDFIVHG